MLVVAAAAAVFAGTAWLASRERRDAPTAAAATEAPAAAPRDAPHPVAAAPLPQLAPDARPAVPEAVSSDLVTRWVSALDSADAATRAAAIAGLARAPRADALPALRRVLQNGEPGVDRPLALRALRDVASAHGDADGQIRAAVRAVIYHGDDAAPAAAAQETLDAIEAARPASLSQR